MDIKVAALSCLNWFNYKRLLEDFYETTWNVCGHISQIKNKLDFEIKEEFYNQVYNKNYIVLFISKRYNKGSNRNCDYYHVYESYIGKFPEHYCNDYLMVLTVVVAFIPPQEIE